LKLMEDAIQQMESKIDELNDNNNQLR